MVSFVFAAMLEDILLPSNMTAKTTLCLDLVKRLIVKLGCAVKVPSLTFSAFSLKFMCKICVQKGVIHNVLKSHSGHVTSYELTHFKKMVQV